MAEERESVGRHHYKDNEVDTEAICCPSAGHSVQKRLRGAAGKTSGRNR